MREGVSLEKKRKIGAPLQCELHETGDQHATS
jgi:hypothetical protein